MTIAERVDTPLEPAEADAAAIDPIPARQATGRWRRPLVVGVVVALALVAAVGGGVLAMRKTVTVTVDGVSTPVTMLAGTVRGALDAAGLQVADHDTLAPAANAMVSDGDSIVLNRGRHITLTLDGEPFSLWTTARTLDAALAELGRSPDAYQLSADRSRPIPVDGLAVSADTLYPVTVHDRGVSRTVKTTSTTVGQFLAAQGIVMGVNDRVSPAVGAKIAGASTVNIVTLPTVTVLDATAPGRLIVSGAVDVAGLLAGAGIALGAQDVVSVPLSTPLSAGLQIGITRISTTKASELVPIEQPADQQVDDGALLKGDSKVVQQGQLGQAQVMYDIVTTNGLETSRTETGRVTTVEALPNVIHVGTKVIAPARAPAPVAAQAPSVAAPVTPQPTPTVSTNPPVAATGTVERVGNQVFFHDFEFGVNWDGLAHCESTNNPRAINASGKYTGLFQFDDQTWRSVGGSGRAYDASPEEQLMRAKLLFQSRGLAPWACAWAA